MKKIKFLILALLGLTIIPTTNAYELGNQSFWSDSWTPSPTTRHKGMCLHYSRDWYMTFDGKTSSYSSISSNNTSCPEGAILGNFFSPKDYSSPWDEGIYNNYFSYVNSKKNGEGMDMIRTVYQNGEHKTVIFTLSSRTAYKRTSNAGIDYMFTQIYFYHNQFILYDPVKEFGLSFLGKMNIVGGAIFSNPSLTDDNLWFVDYIHKKAYSATITNTAAWKRLLGTDVSKERLQAVNWTKSYTINPGGSSFLPPRFKIDKQGGSGYQYIEDIEFVIPERGQGNSSNQNNGQNNLSENYNKCVNYYSDVKNLAYYSQKCGEDPADEETLNRVKVDSWNAETEAQTLINELTGGNKNKCGRFANAKKQYKEKYGAEFEKFYKEFGKYARTPEAVDSNALCSFNVEQEQKKLSLLEKIAYGFESGMMSISKKVFTEKNFTIANKALKFLTFGLLDLQGPQEHLVDSLADTMFNFGRGTEEITDGSGGVVSVAEMYSDREELYEMQKKIDDPNINEIEKQAIIQKYNQKKQKMIKKYQKFSGSGVVASVLGSGFKQGDFKQDSSNIFKKYYWSVLDSFDKGKNTLRFFNSCSGGFFSEINVFVYMFVIVVGLYIFKLFNH